MELMRSDTGSVSVAVPAEFAWGILSDLSCWKNFSPFVVEAERVEADLWRVRSPQGEIMVKTNFDPEKRLLDHEVRLHAGAVMIPYRVVPNLGGCELIMTNFQSPGDSEQEYAEQLDWMTRELEGAKVYLEEAFKGGQAI
jgi:Polyketide cyclase / dehydrase and lipid transport